MTIFLTVVATLAILAALLYVAVLIAAVRASLYPIRIHQFVSPGMMGFPQAGFEVVTKDGVPIRGWVAKGLGDLVVVCAHGYLVNRCEWVPVAQQLVPMGATMVFFDHRGHGRSGRAKVTLGRDERLDVLAVLEWVRQEFPGRKVMLLGSSMGGVACALAAREPGGEVDALVLDAPFRSMKEASDAWWLFLGGEMAARWMRPTSWIGPWFLGFQPEAVRVDHALSELGPDVPVLLFFGGLDPIVPPASAALLADSVKGPVQSVTFPDSTHGAGRLNDPELFKRSLAGFLDRHGLL
ncbi:MAG: alpha/beta fold hydrolase [Armatimonadetes bacterium]|nr:alpha/beta fold hydrolase [Armatimonadota bacterium]MBX3110005.1 alpha/beta fold hydrolase [Fimbriimonadaceae bacterium]